MAQSDLRPKSRKSISDKIADPFLPNYFKISLLKPGWSLAGVNLTFPLLLNLPDALLEALVPVPDTSAICLRRTIPGNVC
jgi:hypothetical protein